MHFVYILACKGGSLYTGYTTDLERRLAQHRAGEGGHYTRSRKPERILHVEEHASRSAAMRREAEIKRWSRKKKLLLIRDGATA